MRNAVGPSFGHVDGHVSQKMLGPAIIGCYAWASVGSKGGSMLLRRFLDGIIFTEYLLIVSFYSSSTIFHVC
jgi:hypothetical protein